VSGGRRAFELDDVSIWVFEVQRQAFAFGAEVLRGRASRGHTMTLKVLNYLRLIEGVHPQAEVVDVSPLDGGCRPTYPTKSSIDTDQVDHRCSSPEVDQA
jgi:hypothetical protein